MQNFSCSANKTVSVNKFVCAILWNMILQIVYLPELYWLWPVLPAGIPIRICLGFVLQFEQPCITKYNPNPFTSNTAISNLDKSVRRWNGCLSCEYWWV